MLVVGRYACGRAHLHNACCLSGGKQCRMPAYTRHHLIRAADGTPIAPFSIRKKGLFVQENKSLVDVVRTKLVIETRSADLEQLGGFQPISCGLLQRVNNPCALGLGNHAPRR